MEYQQKEAVSLRRQQEREDREIVESVWERKARGLDGEVRDLGELLNTMTGFVDGQLEEKREAFEQIKNIRGETQVLVEAQAMRISNLTRLLLGSASVILILMAGLWYNSIGWSALAGGLEAQVKDNKEDIDKQKNEIIFLLNDHKMEFDRSVTALNEVLHKQASLVTNLTVSRAEMTGSINVIRSEQTHLRDGQDAIAEQLLRIENKLDRN